VRFFFKFVISVRGGHFARAGHQNT